MLVSYHDPSEYLETDRADEIVLDGTRKQSAQLRLGCSARSPRACGDFHPYRSRGHRRGEASSREESWCLVPSPNCVSGCTFQGHIGGKFGRLGTVQLSGRDVVRSFACTLQKSQKRRRNVSYVTHRVCENPEKCAYSIAAQFDNASHPLSVLRTRLWLAREHSRKINREH